MGMFDSIGDFVGDLFGNGGGGHNPAEDAYPYLEKIPGVVEEAYNPYIQWGQQAGGNLSEQFARMAKDPTGLLESLMQSYKPSGSFGIHRDEALRAAGNSAAAGGMRGTPNDINNSIDITDRLLSDDMQQWLNNVLGLQTQGLSGQQGLFGTGFQASTGKASDLSNLYGQQAGLAFQGARDKKANQQNLFNSLLGLTGFGAGMSGGSQGGQGQGGGGFDLSKLMAFL